MSVRDFWPDFWTLFKEPLSVVETDALAAYAADRVTFDQLPLRVRLVIQALSQLARVLSIYDALQRSNRSMTNEPGKTPHFMQPIPKHVLESVYDEPRGG